MLSLLEQAQAASDDMREFAWLHLEKYRCEALAAAKEGRDRDEQLQVVAAARERLRGKLKHLLRWAQQIGRM